MKPFTRFTRIAATVVAVFTVLALALSCAREQQDQPVQLTRGEEAYLAYCAMCHGDHGGGNGPLAAALAEAGATRPAHLDDEQRLAELGKAELKRIITLGGLHTGRSGVMPAWGERLDSTLVADIVDHLMTLPSSKPITPDATIQKFLRAPEGSAEDGRRMYVHYCSICHGPQGKGDGYYADTLHARNGIWPRDLTDTDYFKTKTNQDLYVIIALGGGHAGKSMFMPAWTVTLTPAEIKSLISYVRAISGTGQGS